MIRTTFDHQSSSPFAFEKLKAGLLCALMLLTGAPNLHAQAQCADPQETGCQVTVGPYDCGPGVPCYIDYDASVQDSTPGASIHYTVYCDGAVLLTGTMSSPGDIIIVETYGSTDPYNNCYGGNLTGQMYATAPGYSQSNVVGLSI
jgi:hypothetical protein